MSACEMSAYGRLNNVVFKKKPLGPWFGVHLQEVFVSGGSTVFELLK